MAHQPAHWPDHPDDRDEDPPVGVTIRPLHQLPELGQLPTQTVPAFASEQQGVSFGTPGASAMAYYQRARAGEWAGFVRTLPLRLAAVVAAGGLAGTLAHGAGPRLAGPAAALAAGVLGWRLRFRVSPETAAWRRGARGERRTARHLDKLVREGWTVLHDLAIPGSRANGDHLLVGPPGGFLVDSKAWHGHITQAIDGSAWHNGHPLDQEIATVRWEADQLAGAIGAPVLPLLCVHDTRIPWGEIYVDNVPVLTPPGCWPCCGRYRPTWTRSGSCCWPSTPATNSTPPAEPRRPIPASQQLRRRFYRCLPRASSRTLIQPLPVDYCESSLDGPGLAVLPPERALVRFCREPGRRLLPLLLPPAPARGGAATARLTAATEAPPTGNVVGKLRRPKTELS